MKLPPAIMRMKFYHRKGKFCLWVPLFLILPFVLALIIVLLPFFLIALLVMCLCGWRKYLSSGRQLVVAFFNLLHELRGLEVDFEHGSERAFISFS